MEVIFRTILFIVGIINISPAMLTFLPSKISKSYGIEILNVNYELLLRHRAAMFGLIGGLLVYAAISRKLYKVSIFVGLFSMLSFIILYFIIGREINAELRKIMIIDIAAVAILLVGFILYLTSLKTNK